MSITEYFGQNSYPLPPVIEPGRIGNILRYSPDQSIVKPIPQAPVTLTLAKRNEEKQNKNRAEILRLVAAGVKHGYQIAEISQISVSTVWNHLKPLEKNRTVIINRATKPWEIKLNKKAKR